MKLILNISEKFVWEWLHIHLYAIALKNICTVFPRIVSAETILFWIYPYALWPLITVHTGAETIQGRNLFKGGNYSRKYLIPKNLRTLKTNFEEADGLGISIEKSFSSQAQNWLLIGILARMNIKKNWHWYNLKRYMSYIEY